MSNETEPNAEQNPPGEKPALSRRDFLRRAGKEVTEVGGRVVPGAAVARVVLGGTAQPGKEAKPGLFQRFASWRLRNNTPAVPTDTDTSVNTTNETEKPDA